MHIYPDRSGYKLYAVIILATGSCVLKYVPPLSTVDSSVSKQSVMNSYDFVTCMCTIYIHVYIGIVCSTYIVYIYTYVSVSIFWSCFKRWVLWSENMLMS